MNGLTQIFSSISDYLIITIFSILALLTTLSIILSDTPKNSKSKLKTVFLSVLLINIILFLIFSRLTEVYFENSVINVGTISFVFMIILSFLFSIKIAIKIKSSIPKTKRGGNLEEISKDIIKENTKSVIETSLLVLLPVISMYFFGNGSLNVLLIFLFLSSFIVTATSIFFLPIAFRLFNNILD